MPHDFELDHEHEQRSQEHSEHLARAIWSHDNVVFRTVGIDIGSSTSHLLFARVHLKRLNEAHSSRFVVVRREVVWRSPIRFTPFLPDGTIDAGALKHFLDESYQAAGVAVDAIDTGAVILTGEAIKQRNARAIDDLFAQQAGRFVCASAGHALEALLAAHGSGATALSGKRYQCGLHVDIGGGTTKLALLDQGQVLQVSAVAVGGRLLAQDEQGHWSRIDESARLAALELGLPPTPETFASLPHRQALAQRLAAVLVEHILRQPLSGLSKALLLIDALPHEPKPQFLSFSGGVAEYIFGHEQQDHGDIALLLSQSLIEQLKGRLNIPVIEPRERIRATVIGASQFTVQVSGNTVHHHQPAALPVRNVPVVRLPGVFNDQTQTSDVEAGLRVALERLSLHPQNRLAVAVVWQAEPEHARLMALAQAIAIVCAPGLQREQALYVLIDGDVAASLGRLLSQELQLPCPLVCVDGVTLKELDYVDLAEPIEPTGVIPVVIKSLLFA
jgi:ethanolamine utilization protein EutA